MMATLGGDDLHKDDCIFTMYISSSGMLSSYTTLHPHNVSSFSTLHLLIKKIRQNDLTYVPYLPTHFIIFTYSHALSMFPPYTYHFTLCFQKHQHLLQNNSLLWQMLPTKLLRHGRPMPYISSRAAYQPILFASFNNSFSRIACHPNTRTKHLHVPVSTSSAFQHILNLPSKNSFLSTHLVLGWLNDAL